MAITSEYQILNVGEVNSSLEYLDQSISQLDGATADLEDAKKYCDSNSFSIKGNNTFPAQIDEILTQIKNIKDSVKRAKDTIYQAAVDMNKSDRAEYEAYKEEQKRLEEQKAAEANQNGGN